MLCCEQRGWYNLVFILFGRLGACKPPHWCDAPGRLQAREPVECSGAQARRGRRACARWSWSGSARARSARSTLTSTTGAGACAAAGHPLRFPCSASRQAWLFSGGMFFITSSLWYPDVERPGQLSAGPPAAAAAGRPTRPQAPSGRAPGSATGANSTASSPRARWPVRAARRPGKFAHAAHFTLRCGRALPGGRWQRPAVALVADLPAGRLSLEQAETLWHEMGHALHTLLSRTHFQHLSGAARAGRPRRAAATGRGGLLPQTAHVALASWSKVAARICRHQVRRAARWRALLSWHEPAYRSAPGRREVSLQTGR